MSAMPTFSAYSEFHARVTRTILSYLFLYRDWDFISFYTTVVSRMCVCVTHTGCDRIKKIMEKTMDFNSEYSHRFLTLCMIYIL